MRISLDVLKRFGPDLELDIVQCGVCKGRRTIYRHADELGDHETLPKFVSICGHCNGEGIVFRCVKPRPWEGTEDVAISAGPKEGKEEVQEPIYIHIHTTATEEQLNRQRIAETERMEKEEPGQWTSMISSSR